MTEEPRTTSTRPTNPASSRPRFRLGAVIAVAAAAGVVVWLAVGGSNKNTTTTSTTTSTVSTSAAAVSTVGPTLLSRAALVQLSATLNQPIYWAGPIAGDSYELTRISNGSIYVRYLPAGVKAGDPRSSFLIVATYPFPNAYTALKAAAGTTGLTIPDGGLAVISPTYKESVHIAFPSSNYQVEVYDHNPARSLSVAKSGDVRPVS